MKKLFVFFALTVVLSFAYNATATQLIWGPINPSFGGSPFNGAWLMASAQAQNRITEPYDYSRWYKDPLETFEQDLQRQVLSRLARKLVDGAFGEESLEAGHYDLMGYIIDVVPGPDCIAVVIIDSTTGEEIRVEVPYY